MNAKEQLEGAKTELRERIANAIRLFEKETGLLVTECTPQIHTLRQSGSTGWHATSTVMSGIKLRTNADETGLME
jgi:hypothetical protein